MLGELRLETGQDFLIEITKVELDDILSKSIRRRETMTTSDLHKQYIRQRNLSIEEKKDYIKRAHEV